MKLYIFKAWLLKKLERKPVRSKLGGIFRGLVFATCKVSNASRSKG
jgi:hypothetical protein